MNLSKYAIFVMSFLFTVLGTSGCTKISSSKSAVDNAVNAAQAYRSSGSDLDLTRVEETFAVVESRGALGDLAAFREHHSPSSNENANKVNNGPVVSASIWGEREVLTSVDNGYGAILAGSKANPRLRAVVKSFFAHEDAKDQVSACVDILYKGVRRFDEDKSERFEIIADLIEVEPENINTLRGPDRVVVLSKVEQSSITTVYNAMNSAAKARLKRDAEKNPNVSKDFMAVLSPVMMSQQQPQVQPQPPLPQPQPPQPQPQPPLPQTIEQQVAAQREAQRALAPQEAQAAADQFMQAQQAAAQAQQANNPDAKELEYKAKIAEMNAKLLEIPLPLSFNVLETRQDDTTALFDQADAILRNDLKGYDIKERYPTIQDHIDRRAAVGSSCYIPRAAARDVHILIPNEQGFEIGKRADLKNFPAYSPLTENSKSTEEFLRKIEDKCREYDAKIINSRILRPAYDVGLPIEQIIQQFGDACLMDSPEEKTLSDVRKFFTENPWNAANIDAHNGIPLVLNRVNVIPGFIESTSPFKRDKPSYNTRFIGEGGIDVGGVTKDGYSTYTEHLAREGILKRFDGEKAYSINPDFNEYSMCTRAGEERNVRNCFFNLGLTFGRYLKSNKEFAMFQLPLSPYLYQRMLGHKPRNLVERMAMLRLVNSTRFFEVIFSLNVDDPTHLDFWWDFTDTGRQDEQDFATYDANDVVFEQSTKYNIYRYFEDEMVYKEKEVEPQVSALMAGFHTMVPLNKFQEKEQQGKLNANTLRLAFEKVTPSVARTKAAILASLLGGAGTGAQKQRMRSLLAESVEDLHNENVDRLARNDGSALSLDTPEYKPKDFVRNFLEYWTGAGYLPDADATHQLQINLKSTSENLPVTHTCFNTIDLPLYLGLANVNTDAEIKAKIKSKLIKSMYNAVGLYD